MMRRAFLSIFVSGVIPRAVLGCPFCDSPVGRQVEAGIFNEQFIVTAGQLALPLIILSAIVAFLHFDLARVVRGGRSLQKDHRP